MKRIVIFLCLSLLSISCDKQVDWDLKFQEVDLLVVEGKITNGAGPHEVRITLPVYEMNGTPEPVSGALVEVNDGDTIHVFAEDPLRDGIYLSPPGLIGTVGRWYQLRIRHGGKRITAVTQMVKVTPFQRMNLFKAQDDPPLLGAFISDSDVPAIVRMELDWSHVVGYEDQPDSATHAVVYHYTLNGVDVNKMFKPPQEQIRFPPGTIIFREKESVNGWYGEFLRGLLSETDWRGGMFDVLPGNARTNMQGEAIGFFTAADVLRDTIPPEDVQID
jgi:hypothetical protein